MATSEFVLGGAAAALAGILTNPLEVAKTRMQLQGELAARGHYQVHYRNVLHAFYTVGQKEGIFALQKGLMSALWYQFVMNGARLGGYQICVNAGWTTKPDGRKSFVRSVAAGAISGAFGASLASPLYLVKTHLQAQAATDIAVGHQHNHTGTWQGLRNIYGQHGVMGLWRGVGGAIPRVMVGSSSQLTTFSLIKDWLEAHKIFPVNSWKSTLTGTCASCFTVTFFMTPFDVVSLRLYNQPVDAHGKGKLYSGFVDCVFKIMKKEGLWGFYKGWAAVFLRLGPHTVFSLMFWDQLRKIYISWKTPLELAP